MLTLTNDRIQKLGASLRPIRQNLLRFDEPNGILRMWYQGEEPYFDIFFDFQDQTLVWFQFTLRGQCLTWHKDQGIQTGFTNEVQVNPERYPASKLIKTHAQLDQAFIGLTRSILATRSEEYPFDQALEILES